MRNFRSKMSIFLYPFTCLPALILATVMTAPQNLQNTQRQRQSPKNKKLIKKEDKTNRPIKIKVSLTRRRQKLLQYASKVT